MNEMARIKVTLPQISEMGMKILGQFPTNLAKLPLINRVRFSSGVVHMSVSTFLACLILCLLCIACIAVIQILIGLGVIELPPPASIWPIWTALVWPIWKVLS